MENAKDRASHLLRLASIYIRNGDTSEIMFYDGVQCDGECLAADCDAAAEALEQSE